MADNGVTLFDRTVRRRLSQCRRRELLLSLKTERVSGKVYQTRCEARADVFEYIARFYNAVRRHSTIGYTRPVDIDRKVALT